MIQCLTEHGCTNDDKTIPLDTLVEFLTDQNVESTLLEELVESLDVSRVEALCAQNTLTASVINASNVLALIPAQPSQPLVSTNSSFTTSKIPR